MRRVVITGMGIVSCLGNDPDEVLTSLRTGKSGITFNETYRDLGFRSHISGTPNIDLGALIDRKSKRFMGDAAAYTYVSMQQAIEDAGLSENEVSHERTGLIVGSGGASSQNVVEGADTLRAKGIKRVGPYLVTRCMSSTVSACLATPFKIRGVNYSITSACATSVHCIGNAVELIQWGKQDLVFAGGGDEEHWSLSLMFDGMGALSSKYNDTPERASRPFDVDRDGFVIAGGGGVLVLEEYEHAKARGAKIYAEVVGYGATSDGANMVAPSGEGAVRCMRQSLADVKEPVQYINAHGTSTPMGDITELDALREVFADQATAPKVTSTKSLSGHSLGAAGVHEAIYSLLMLKEDFISPSVNIENRDPGAEGVDIPQATVENAGLHTVVSNSFGFGGTNGTLVFQKV